MRLNLAEGTSSRLIFDFKQRRAWTVFRWVTAWGEKPGTLSEGRGHNQCDIIRALTTEPVSWHQSPSNRMQHRQSPVTLTGSCHSIDAV